MPSGGKRRKYPKRLSFRPNRTSRWSRFGQQWRRRWPAGVVLADAAYGINTEFRDGLTKLGLQYVVGVQSSMTVWEPGKQPLPAKPRGKMGRPPRLLQRTLARCSSTVSPKSGSNDGTGYIVAAVSAW